MREADGKRACASYNDMSMNTSFQLGSDVAMIDQSIRGIGRLRMPVVSLGVILALAVLTPPSSARAQGPARWALAVGNEAYVGPEVSPLPKSPRDADSMATKLTSLGFTTMPLKDATWDMFSSAVFDLRGRVKQDDIVLVYFSGHGFQHDNYNYLVPIGARLGEPSLLARENVGVDWIIATLSESRPAVILLLLDACRQVRFSTRNGQSKGLVQQQGMQRIDVPPGALVGYAASPGRVAWTGDGDVANSVYTDRLLASLDTVDVDILNVLGEVRRQVWHATVGDQVPNDDNRLLGPVYLHPGPVAELREDTVWAGVGSTLDLLTTFIEQFPGGRHVPEARAKLRLLSAAPAAASGQPNTLGNLTITGPLRESRVAPELMVPTLEPSSSAPTPIPGPKTTVFGTRDLSIFQDRNIRSPLVAQVAPTTGLVLLGLPPAGETGWAQVRTPTGSIGYVGGVTPTRQPAPAAVSVELPFAAGQLVPDSALVQKRVGDVLSRRPTTQSVEIRVPASVTENSLLGHQTAFIRAVGIRSILMQLGLPDEQISIRLLEPQQGAGTGDVVANLQVRTP